MCSVWRAGSVCRACWISGAGATFHDARNGVESKVQEPLSSSLAQKQFPLRHTT